MWSDTESDVDYLNFGEVSKLTVDILTSPGMLPVSLGIFGNWGAGKSSLLKLIERELEEEKGEYIIANFDAWLYQGYDDARAALLEAIATKLCEVAKKNETLLAKTKNLLARVNVFRAMGWIVEGSALAAGIPTGGLLAKSIGSAGKLIDFTEGETDLGENDYQDIQKTAKDCKKEISDTLRSPSSNTPPQQISAFRKAYGEILKELGHPLIVIIDNLDRCLPPNAIQTLEAIRLFLFLPNTAFIIAADEEMIRGAVAEYFSGSSERHRIDYLDKLIQIPIRVPKAGIREVRAYLFMLFAMEQKINQENLEKLRRILEDSLQKSWQEDPIDKTEALELAGIDVNDDMANAFDLADRIAPILANSPVIHGNPRIVKRLLNVIRMRTRIALRRKMPLDESVITKLVIFERCAGMEATADLYRMIDSEGGTPEILRKIENGNSMELPSDAPESWGKNPSTNDFIIKWSKLEPTLKDIDLRAAVYLSRETLPIGVYVVGLSPQGREALETLLETKKRSSPNAQKIIQKLRTEDQLPVMEGLIDQLRRISDWLKKPKGYAGACMLADQSPEAAILLRRFVNSMTEKPPWMNVSLKKENWYKDN